MDSVLGIPITTVLIVVLAGMATCLASTAVVAWRNPVVFRMAVRNVPRRRAQSVLIMVGLMLSTLIITAALSTGDTLDSSLTGGTYDSLGHVDETIAFADPSGESDLSVANPTFDASIADELRARLNDDSNVDGVMPVLTVDAPAINADSGLSEPSVIVTGLDAGALEGFGTLRTTGGEAVDFATLPAGSALLSDELAESIGATAGSTVTFYYEGTPQTLTVADVVPGSILTGYAPATNQAGPAQTTSAGLLGIAVPLTWLQDFTGMQAQARFIAVSNTGGVESGLDATDTVVPALRAALDGIAGGESLGVNPVKQDAIDTAETASGTFTSLFLILGLFSIAAGVLLILLIFTMLAAERRPEMGMARAIGMTRGDLVQGFIVEGTVYDLGAALIGATAGVLVSVVMASFMGNLAGDVAVTPAVSLQSLLLGYALGVTVTFVTVIFASLRASQLGIVAAIRDLPDAPHEQARKKPSLALWSRVPLQRVMWLSPLRFVVELLWNTSLLAPRLVLGGGRYLTYLVGGGAVTAVIGAGILALGTATQTEAPFSLGLSLVGLGMALFARRFFPSRIVYTVVSALMLLYWGLPASVTDPLLPPLNGDAEMFFVSGIFMVLYMTLIVVWNLDVVVALVAVLGRSASRWLPAIQTAVAYPMASRGRTGMTIAMFALVIFSVVTMRTINANFIAALLSDEAGAGWDVRVTTNPSNPIADLNVALSESGAEVPGISQAGRVATLDASRGFLRTAGEIEWSIYAVSGMDAAFIDGSTIPLTARAPGYDSDEAVWHAVSAGENVAVIDSAAFDDGGFGGEDGDRYMAPEGVVMTDGSIPPFEVELLDLRSGATERFTVIGVISSKVGLLQGIFIGDQSFADLYGSGDSTVFYVQADGDAGDVATSIESALRTRGVQAEAVDDLLADMQSSAVSFFTLIQGFMALGLFVGIAALGVISFRSVVERRQQIGMLRAIGFEQRMVGATFVIESLVVASIGVVSGAVLSLLLSYNLVMGSGFDETTQFDSFVVPWGNVAFFVGAALVAAALMTWIPARRASQVPIAEALRYE